MSYYKELEKLRELPFEEIWQNAGPADVERVLGKEELTREDFLILLSPAAGAKLDRLAARAQDVTERHFHKKIALFAPLYISDHCTNHCVYCSFSMTNEFPRSKLGMEEIAAQGALIAQSGIDQLLILTGDSLRDTPVSYIRQSAEVLRDHFSWLGVEINALETEGYRELVQAGVQGLTIYQEVYEEDIYRELHPKGPKRNYRFRLDAPERGCQAGMRSVGIGALLGLNDWRREVFYTGMHARYLQEHYPDTAISLSPPRMRPFAGAFQPRSVLEDRDLMQVVLAYRLFLPRCGITLSTREPAEMRDKLVSMGITKMSAGVSTQVGGYAEQDEEGVPQFQISDERTVSEVCRMLTEKGYRPQIRTFA